MDTHGGKLADEYNGLLITHNINIITRQRMNSNILCLIIIYLTDYRTDLGTEEFSKSVGLNLLDYNIKLEAVGI